MMSLNLPCHLVKGDAVVAAPAGHVVLKIRRRKFNQQQFTPEKLRSRAGYSVLATANIC